MLRRGSVEVSRDSSRTDKAEVGVSQKGGALLELQSGHLGWLRIWGQNWLLITPVYPPQTNPIGRILNQNLQSNRPEVLAKYGFGASLKQSLNKPKRPKTHTKQHPNTPKHLPNASRTVQTPSKHLPNTSQTSPEYPQNIPRIFLEHPRKTPKHPLDVRYLPITPKCPLFGAVFFGHAHV